MPGAIHFFNQYKRLIYLMAMVLLLLTIPLIAMQFTQEVRWSFSDFVMMGVLLTSTGLACDFIWRKVHKVTLRIGLILGALLVFVLIWAELAVGIFS